MSINDLDATEFNPIDELDPSLSQGYRVIYDREVLTTLPTNSLFDLSQVPMEIRHHYTGEQSISTGTLEAIKIKVSFPFRCITLPLNFPFHPLCLSVSLVDAVVR
jgi:hypothetical protein